MKLGTPKKSQITASQSKGGKKGLVVNHLATANTAKITERGDIFRLVDLLDDDGNLRGLSGVPAALIVVVSSHSLTYSDAEKLSLTDNSVACLMGEISLDCSHSQ